MENNCFTMLCWFLSHVSMKQPRVYVCPLPLEPPSHLPPDTTPHGCHGAPGWAPCVIEQTPAVCVTRGDVCSLHHRACRGPLSALHVVTCVVSEPPASYSRLPLSALHVVTCMFPSPLHHTADARCLRYTWWRVFLSPLHHTADARCLHYTWWRVCFWAPCVIQQTPTVCVTRGDVCFWAPCIIQQTPAVCVTRGDMCFTATLLICPSLSCCCVHTSVLPVCVSTAALQIGSSRPFSRFHIFFT